MTESISAVEYQCPCCARPMYRKPSLDEIREHANLTISQQIIFDQLAPRVGKRVPTVRIYHALWGHLPDGGPGNARMAFSALRHRLSKKLKPFGLAIRGYGSRRWEGGETVMAWEEADGAA